jgi:hypothetical protein
MRHGWRDGEEDTEGRDRGKETEVNIQMESNRG